MSFASSSNKGSRVRVWHRRGTVAVLMGLALGCALVGYEGDAAACGACFASQSESTIVNDHRMALSISKEHTILWDQISYSGNPKEFAYVLPARPGTRLEPSKEAWFASLDASTRPIIMSPQSSGGGGGGGGYHGGGGAGDDGYDSEGRSSGSGGCCSTGSLTSASSDRARGGAGSPGYSGSGQDNSAGAAPEAPREPVTVVDQAVVGPYETVTLRANEPNALQKWLVANGYEIPAIAGPVIEKYVEEGFDFIALRLRPGKDVRAMEPIRIVSPGADPSMPLRLMQIGAGARIGITLYVITEGRYRTANFRDVPIEFDKLVWDQGQNRSNYQELSQKAMTGGDGRGFITEYADHPQSEVTGQPPQAGMLSNPGLGDAYSTSCRVDPTQPPWQEKEAGAPPVDASDPDAGADDPDGGADPDGDGGTDDGGVAVTPPPPPKWTPKQCDDLEIALAGLHQNDVWITRLRANLPRAALDATLKLEPTEKQERLENIHYARSVGSFTPGAARVAHKGPMGTHGTYALIAATAFFVSRLLRRKKSRG